MVDRSMIDVRAGRVPPQTVTRASSSPLYSIRRPVAVPGVSCDRMIRPSAMTGDVRAGWLERSRPRRVLPWRAVLTVDAEVAAHPIGDAPVR